MRSHYGSLVEWLATRFRVNLLYSRNRTQGQAPAEENPSLFRPKGQCQDQPIRRRLPRHEMGAHTDPFLTFTSLLLPPVPMGTRKSFWLAHRNDHACRQRYFFELRLDVVRGFRPLQRIFAHRF